jgi:signal transduction histidine kinase
MASLRDRFLAVCENRADAVLFYPESGFYSLVGSKDLLECRERGLRFVPIPQPLMKLSIASLPENKTLADRMRRSLAKMAADHTMEKLGSLRVLGDQKSLSLMFETERATYQQRILLISLGSLSGLILLLCVAALAVATRAERVKSEFLANMSHEIRTPMTAVLGYMEMLLATGLRHDQRQFANEVCRATNSLLTILTTVLDYSRSLGGKQPVVKEEFDLTAVVEDSIAALLLEAEAEPALPPQR